jgi:hypothetical protein
MSMLYVLLGVVLITTVLFAGYWFGLRQFEGRLKGELLQRDKVLARTAAAAQARPPEIRSHTVLLDGVSESGKTTFMARLACPTMTADDLKKVPKTMRQDLSHEVPLCWERVGEEGAPVLHAMRFFDVAGEGPETVANAIDHLADELSSPDDQRHVVAVWVWDMSNRPGNRDRMSVQVLRTLYRRDRARALVKRVVVFLNKLDLIDGVNGRGDHAQQLAEEEKYIRGVLDQIGAGHEIQFHAGSALDGRGLQDAFGSIVKFFELEEHYPKLNERGPSA